MVLKKLILGIDVGTTALKTIIVNELGEVIAEALVEYPLSVPHPKWAEQDPELWWDAAKLTITKVLTQVSDKSAIVGIGLSGQMHGMVAIGDNGRVLRPCITWADQRNSVQCQEIHDLCGGVSGLIQMTNNRMLAGYTGGKIRWFQQEEPNLFENTKIILLPKDYIRYKLTNEFATEVSDASGTGLFDVKNRRWSKKLLSVLDIPIEIMPNSFESIEISGVTGKWVEEEFGLPQGIPVVGGGADAVIAMTGLGVINEGDFGSSLGTGGVIATALDDCYENPDGLLQISCNNVPGKWHAMGVTMGAGGAFRWIKEAISSLEIITANQNGEDVYDLLCKQAEEIEAGSNGLIFLPHLFGSRCPHDDALSRGAFVGLTFQHKKAHMYRAVLEGVMFSFKEMSEVIERMGVQPKNVRISGGGARSRLWRQIMADVFNVNVYTVSGSVHGGSFGAALIAGVGTGIWSNIHEALQVLKNESQVDPDQNRVDKYSKILPIFKDLYPSLKEIFHELWIE